MAPPVGDAVPARHKRTVDAIVETFVYLYTESRRLTKDRARAYGLTGPQLTVIKMLAQLGDLSLSSLSERIKAQNSTVTGIIDRMEREELVRRERGREDRRIVLIRLTEKGQRLAREVQLEPMEIFRAALRELPKRDVDELFRVLDTLQRRVRELVIEGEAGPDGEAT